MEARYQHTVNGQSVLQADLNTLGEAASLADDRVFAELLRMTPYDGATVSRGILPYASGATVAANGASGSVKVNPFRAFVGSRTAVASDAKKNWRDVRSAIVVGTATLEQTVAIGANASGNPRWDLIYAAVAVDANSASVTRKVKDATTKAIAGASLVTTLETTATLGVTAGTPGASPAFPATPSDSGGTYYVPIAYVRVPNGFGAASTVTNKDIDTIAKVLAVAQAAGGSTLRPANQQHAVGGTAISGAGTSTVNGALKWGATANTRPALFLPPSMSGGESRIIAIDVGNASNANWSHQDGAIVDDSVDWRNRVFKWMASVGPGSSSFAGKFPWLSSAGVNLVSPTAPSAGGVAQMAGYAADANHPAFALGMGDSFTTGTGRAVAQVSASGAAAAATPATGYNIPTNAMASGGTVYLYVDASTGALKVSINAGPLASLIFWLDATAPFENY